MWLRGRRAGRVLPQSSVHDLATAIPSSLYLWCAQPILQSVVAAILWRRKLHKQFPVFFLFLVVQVAIFCRPLSTFARPQPQDVFIFFWLGEAVNAVLGFKIIHEIFLDVFRPYHTLKDLGTLLFRWAGVVMLLVSVVVAFSNSFDQSPLLHALTTLQRSVRIVQIGLILFLLLFSRFLGVSRKQISFGISLGFGLFAGVDLMMYALNSGGFVRPGIFNLINMSAYNLAIFVWLGYSLSRQASARGCQPLADPALGTELGRSPASRAFRFADPDVRRHGGARIFAKLESGSGGRSFPVRARAPEPPRANSAAAGSKNRP